MVKRGGAFCRSGYFDWAIQRISALVLVLYLIGVLAVLVSGSLGGFEEWQALWSRTGVKLATIAAVLALLAHAWVGIWTVITDYVKGACQTGVMYLFAAALGACGLWAGYVVWGF